MEWKENVYLRMPPLEWSDEHSVGVWTLDAQHKQLIGFINELQTAIVTGHAKKVLEDMLQKLMQYALTHLETEERLLRTHGYPGFLQHKAQHEAFMTKMLNFERQQAAGQTISIELLKFMKEWWSHHILKVDRQYADFLKSKNAN
jgi:hemerythrin